MVFFPYTRIWHQKLFLTLFTVLFFPDNLSAQGLPIELDRIAGRPVVHRACVLGVILAYGILRNRNRSRAQKQVTDDATKDLYAKENRDSGGEI